MQKDNHWENVSIENPKRLMDAKKPPWLENVDVTPDLIYRYQVSTKAIADILQSDSIALKKTKQVSKFFN